MVPVAVLFKKSSPSVKQEVFSFGKDGAAVKKCEYGSKLAQVQSLASRAFDWQDLASQTLRQKDQEQHDHDDALRGCHPSGDVTKLPKWAQEHIRSLELQNQSLTSDMAQMTGTMDSPASYSVGTETPLPLPKNATVRFQLGEGSDEVINAKVQTDQGRTILVIGALTRKIIIEPTASNRIVLTTSWE